MRQYGQIQCSYWTHPDIVALSNDAKLLGAYLLTGPHSNGIGCYRLPIGYLTGDFRWSSEAVGKAFEELFAIGFVNYCDRSQFVFMPKFLKFNPISNRNVAKNREKEFLTIPSTVKFYRELARSLLDYGNHFSKEYESLWQSLLQDSLEGVGKQEPTREEPIRTQPKKGGVNGNLSVDEFIASCKDRGELAIPEDDPIFDYAEKAGLPPEFVRLAWREFVTRYRDGGKKQKGINGWRQAFRNAVRGNWYKLWYAQPEGGYALTTTGVQAQKVHAHG